MSGQIALTDKAKLAYVHETYPGCVSTHQLNYLLSMVCELAVAKVATSKVDFFKKKNNIMVFVDREDANSVTII